MSISASRQLELLQTLEGLAQAHPDLLGFCRAVETELRERLSAPSLAVIPLANKDEAEVATKTPVQRGTPFERAVEQARNFEDEVRHKDVGHFRISALVFGKSRVGAAVSPLALWNAGPERTILAFALDAVARIMARIGLESDESTKSYRGAILRPDEPATVGLVPFEPQRFGKYFLVQRMAVGGMAEILLARSALLGGITRPCVVKRVLPHLCQHTRFVSLFIDEARVSMNLIHPNIVRLFDFGQVEGNYYMAMELVRGTDLSRIGSLFSQQGGGLPPAAVAFIGLSICRALEFAHGQRDPDGRNLNIVHRDVTPHNVLVSEVGEVKLADFGIAQARNSLTEATEGLVVGKTSYMSPEQTRGEELDATTDLWAVGVILHELLTGKRLFRCEHTEETVAAVRTRDFEPPSTMVSDVPETLDNLIMSALNRDRRARIQSARVMATALEDVVKEAGYNQSAFLKELKDAGWKPRQLPERFAASTGMQRTQTPAALHQVPDVMLDAEVVRHFESMRADPDLWVLSEISERFAQLKQVEWAKAASRTAAALFGFQGLFVQAACVLHRARPFLGDGQAQLDLNRLVVGGRGDPEKTRQLLRDWDPVGFAAFVPEAQFLLDEDAAPPHTPDEMGAMGPLLELLRPLELADLLWGGTLEVMEPGTQIVSEGQSGDCFYALGRGRAVVYCAHDGGSRAHSSASRDSSSKEEASRETSGAKRIPLHTDRIFLSALSDGDLFGEISFLTLRQRTATVETLTDAWVLRFSRARTEELVESSPGLDALLRDFYRLRIGELLLSRNPIFSALPVAALRHLLLNSTAVKARDGEEIVREGEKGTDLFVIIDGEVEVDRKVEGIEAFINKLSTGDFFGERGALHEETRSATIRAMGDVELLRLTRTQVLDALSGQEHAQRLFERAMEVRRMDLEDRVAEIRGALAGL
jgi:serine/threonine protein kinase/CRP-like cAMP-binding protein